MTNSCTNTPMFFVCILILISTLSSVDIKLFGYMHPFEMLFLIDLTLFTDRLFV